MAHSGQFQRSSLTRAEWERPDEIDFALADAVMKAALAEDEWPLCDTPYGHYARELEHFVEYHGLDNLTKYDMEISAEIAINDSYWCAKREKGEAE